MTIFKNIETDAHDEKWTEAVELFRKGDKSGALFRFKRLAYEGCSPALVEIGNIYEIGGGGIEKDIDKARQWYINSVETIDDPRAHLALGRIYYRTTDYRSAFYHLSILENRRDPGAMFGLALLYDFGLGVNQDHNKAAKYYRIASDKGHILALKNLSIIKMKKSFPSGVFLWVKACLKIWKTGLRNPYDRRLGIR